MNMRRLNAMNVLSNSDLIYLIVIVSLCWIIGLLTCISYILFDMNKECKKENKELKTFLGDLLRRKE